MTKPTRADVAHLKPGMEVTATFRVPSSGTRVVTGEAVLRPNAGGVAYNYDDDPPMSLMVDASVLRYSDGEPGMYLEEIVSPRRQEGRDT